jgi:hypothetical protein
MRSIFKIANLLTGLFVGTSILYAQGEAFNKVGTTSFQFLKVNSDARSTAMGGAFIAVGNSSGAVFSNPAAIAKVDKADFSISQLDYLLDMSHQSFSLVWSFNKLGTIGIHGMEVDIGDVEETKVENLGFLESGIYNPGLTGNIVTPGAQVFGLSFAKQISEKFAFGITTKYAHEDLVVEDASAIIVDAGFNYSTGFKSLQLATAIKNFGPEIKFRKEGESYPLPQELSIGVAGYILGKSNPLFAESDKHGLLVAFDMLETRDYGQQFNVGFEYSMYDMFFIRTGQRVNYDIEGLTLGFGINAPGGIRFDYSYASYGESFGPVSRFTIGYGKN